MWCDDFDMDLPKVVPDAYAESVRAADVVLVTRGHVTDGQLNHPAAWNWHPYPESCWSGGFRCFFGTTEQALEDQGVGPESYYNTTDPIVHAPWPVIVRDLWAHHLALFLDGELLWDSGVLECYFNTIMYDLRQWNCRDPVAANYAKHAVRNDIARATDDLLRKVQPR